jgi:hypothetical protein
MSFARRANVGDSRNGGSAQRPADLPELESLEPRLLLSSTLGPFSMLLDTEPLGEPGGGPVAVHAEMATGGESGGDAGGGGTGVLLSSVPAYYWYRGCGPTAAGMVLGYYDGLGYSNLAEGDASSYNSSAKAMIASSEHYNEYSKPIDNPGSGIQSDLSTLGGAHESNCIADFMKTSWSSRSNYYGWTWFSSMDDGLEDYAAYKGYEEARAWNESWGTFTWNDLVSEIDAGRPIVLLVDTDGNGGTDHFVTAIGYDAETSQYACYNTWDYDVHWYSFRQMQSGNSWGIYGATFFDPGPIADSIAPSASLTAEDLSEARDWHDVTVTYTDNMAVDVSDLDSSDVRVTGPDGEELAVSLQGVDADVDGTVRWAVYRIGGPDGTWDFTDNGTYTVWMEPGEVSDTNGNWVAAAELGQFAVDIAAPPTALDDSFTIQEDEAAELDLLANDSVGPDIGDSLQIAAVVAGPTHGTVTIVDDGARVLYTPGQDFVGEDVFSYEIVDADGLTATATVTLAVEAVNDRPTLSSAELGTAQPEWPFTIDYASLLARTAAADVDSPELWFRIESVENGTLTLDGAAVSAGVSLLGPGQELVWTPDAGTEGESAAFTVSAWDGDLASAEPVVVAVDVAPVGPLLAWYKLDGAADDASDYGLHGTIVGDTPFHASPHGQAIEFDGQSTYVDLGMPDLLRFQGMPAMTVLAWVRADSLGRFDGIVSNSESGLQDGVRFSFEHYEGQLRVSWGDGESYGSYVSAPGSLNETGRWYHVGVVITRDGTLTFYVDGEQSGPTYVLQNELALSSESWKIGANYAQPTLGWNGQVDDVKFFNTSLSIADINLERATGLVSHYTMDGDVSDQSGHGADGRIVGDVTFVAGPTGEAVHFAPGSYVDLGTPGALSLAGVPDMTVAAWVKAESLDRYAGIVSNSEGGTADKVRFSLEYYDDRLRVTWGDGTTCSRYYAAPDSLNPTGEWYHVAVVTSSQDGTLRLFVNGEQSGPTYELANELALSTTGWRIGDNYSNPNYTWEGAIDDVRIYNVALSTEEIGQLQASAQTSSAINFNSHTFTGYSIQDGQFARPTVVEVLGDGTTVRLSGNAWKQIAMQYAVTENTVIEFDFRSTAEGEIHAIGLDNDEDHRIDRTFFQLSGTQSWDDQDCHTYNNYAGTDWVHYVIPVGTFYTGDMNRLVFVNDHDRDATAVSEYKNVRIYEPQATVQPTLDLDSYTVSAYNSLQDGQMGKPATAEVLDNGSRIRLTGNTWKQIGLDHLVTADTVIEFDVRVTSEGEIHAIGFDNDDDFQIDKTFFQLSGTQSWSTQYSGSYNDYTGTDWVHYVIPVGRFYIGNMDRLVFVNDDDAHGTAVSEYRNIRVYESHGEEPVEPGVDFGDSAILAYTFQDGQNNLSTAAEVLDDGATLELTGNSWKQMSFDYTVTENTVLEFDFQSSSQGEVQGIGLDEDEDYGNNDRIFQLFGTQRWGIQACNNYDGIESIHYVISVGQFYTGDMSRLVFVNDCDRDASGVSRFSNVRVYESTSG